MQVMLLQNIEGAIRTVSEGLEKIGETGVQRNHPDNIIVKIG